MYTVTARRSVCSSCPRAFPRRQVYAYGGMVNFSESGQTPDIRTAFTMPGPTFEAVRGRHILVRYRNELDGRTSSPSIPPSWWRIPTTRRCPSRRSSRSLRATTPRRVRSRSSTHLHGGVTPSDSDGFPEAWFTRGRAVKKGPAFTRSTFRYLNAQLATTLWYHDHTLGMTRLNVVAGLEGHLPHP